MILKPLFFPSVAAAGLFSFFAAPLPAAAPRSTMVNPDFTKTVTHPTFRDNTEDFAVFRESTILGSL